MQANQVIKGRVLYVSRKHIFAARGARIYKSLDKGLTWQHQSMLPVNNIESILLDSRLLRRLLRRGIHHIEVGDSRALLIANRTLYRLDGSSVKPLGLVQGSRPLTLCVANDAFYIGEYRSNQNRSPIHLWKWHDAEKKWKAMWRFNNIRHVHGVFYDPYMKSIWVTTGDHDHEAGIFRTDDNFSTLIKIAGGSQKFRAIQLLFTNNFVYFGSDAPKDQNYIYRMDRDGKNIEILIAVSSSVFYGCKVGKNLFFSTAVEPSKFNTTRHAEVWGSADKVTWRVVCRFNKDIWPMRYFQYGQVLFPSGPGDGKHLWLTPIATEYDQKSFKIPVANIFTDNS